MFNQSNNRVINTYPGWKYLLLLLMIVVGFIYAAPILYGDVPAIQVTANTRMSDEGDAALEKRLVTILTQAKIPYRRLRAQGNYVQVQLADLDQQLQAKEALQQALGNDYTVALSLAPATPAWLTALGAVPMKLGLDLRGGIHFLLDVDVNSVLSRRLNGDVRSIGESLRTANIRYTGIVRRGDDGIVIHFHQLSHLQAALPLVKRQFPELSFTAFTEPANLEIVGKMDQDAYNKAQDYVIDQTMTTLRNRVNELGISEAVVQRQGADRISVDLPGVLDAGRAKQILGGTATLEFHLVDARSAAGIAEGQEPFGTQRYELDGHPLLLKKQIVLQGSSITNAMASIGQDGRPSVDIRLGGGGESLFNRVTRANIGQRMAIVYVETKTSTQMIDGKPVKIHRKVERVISAPVIQSALGSNFQITGLEDPREANNLSLLLRAGSLPANIDIAQERNVGPTLGKENIKKGLYSIVIGFVAIVVFMFFYYGLFGLFADIALFMNLVLLVALLSILGMTLTLPGIAGIVLTVGMAVDANVLIFERIREELRNGVSVQGAIFAGYERAFSTIVDANVTTLIAAVALFVIGSGPIKGFAVVLIFGLLTSMVTAITGTRALTNLIYGNRVVKKLSIGL